MRIALDTGTPVGFRTARVLLGDSEITHVGVLDPAIKTTGRSSVVEDLSTYDALVSDGTTDHHELIGRCSVAGVPLVLWPDLPGLATGPSHMPVIKGANVAIGLTAALFAHPTADVTENDAVRIGWTEPGAPQRTGEAMPFPDPIGSIWTTERSQGQFVGFRDDEWGGAVIEVIGPAGTRIVGVGDHAEFMEAITLAAVAVLAARGRYESAIQDASSESLALLDQVTRMELDVAAWRSISE